MCWFSVRPFGEKKTSGWWWCVWYSSLVMFCHHVSATRRTYGTPYDVSGPNLVFFKFAIETMKDIVCRVRSYTIVTYSRIDRMIIVRESWLDFSRERPHEYIPTNVSTHTRPYNGSALSCDVMTSYICPHQISKRTRSHFPVLFLSHFVLNTTSYWLTHISISSSLRTLCVCVRCVWYNTMCVWPWFGTLCIDVG